MTTTNEILAFAIDPAANVLSQEDYEAQNAGAGFVALGFSAGLARSDNLNKVWRQSSFMAAGLASFVAAQGINVLDDGDLPTLADNIAAAILTATRTSPAYTEDTGVANAYIGTLSPVPAALTQDLTVDIRIAHTNTGASVFNLNGEGSLPITHNGTALIGGEMVAGQIYTLKFDTNTNTWQLVSSTVTPTTVYTGTAPTTHPVSVNAQILAAVTPVGFSLTYGYIVNFTAGATNNAACTLNVAATGVNTIKKTSGAGLVDVVSGDIANGSSYSVFWDGTYYVLIDPSFNPASFLQVANNLGDLANVALARANLGLAALAQLGVGANLFSSGGNLVNGNRRISLTANTTYYVATTGNDANAGTIGSPWLTLQHAIDYVHDSIDLNGFVLTISVANGTYTAGVSAQGVFTGAANPSSGVKIIGNTAAPAAAIIHCTSADCFSAGAGAQFFVDGFTLTTTTAGDAIQASGSGSAIDVGGHMIFGSVPVDSVHIKAIFGGTVTLTDDYQITGGASYHYYSDMGSQIIADDIAVTMSGVLAFVAFVTASDRSSIRSTGSTFLGGAVTGRRYIGRLNAVIYTEGSASYFPGNAAGTLATGAQYA